ncbi:hypothetical protein EMCRGX_G031343 [Ephydatia muelleri]
MAIHFRLRQNPVSDTAECAKMALNIGIDVYQCPQSCSAEGLDRLCSQLTALINSKDFENAKKIVSVLSMLKSGAPNVKFHVQLAGASSKPQTLGPLMTLTVHIEFQANKAPIKVFIEVGEMATFADVQVLVEEQLRIPCATQNWIVGNKLVTTGNLMKKLCDYGIKKDSKEPPLYLYVVHPKKANVSREDLMRVGITQTTAAHPDPSQSLATNGQYPGNQFQQAARSERNISNNHYAVRGVASRSDHKVHPAPVSGKPLRDLLPPVKVQAPLPPPPPPKPVGWECPMCTYINKPQRPGCEQCATPRPEDYKVPNDATLDDCVKREEELMKQFLEQEKQEQLKQRDQNYAALMKADDTPLNTNAVDFDCMICYTPVQAGEGVILRGCLHEFCKDCLKGHINTTTEAEPKCPYHDGVLSCDSPISEREIRALLTEQEVENVYLRSLRQAENADGRSFHCRTPNCNGFCFYDDNVNEFTCQVCNKKNCILCKAIHDGMNCQEYQDDLKRRAVNDAAAKATQDMLEGLIAAGDAMYCPQCKIMIQKKNGCDWLQCMMCKTEICWVTKGPRWGPRGQGDTSGGLVHEAECLITISQWYRSTIGLQYLNGY